MLVHAPFPHPELSFTYNTGDPNIRSAIDADELDFVHRALERRPG